MVLSLYHTTMPCQPKHPNTSAHRNRCDKIYENYSAKLANITPSRNRGADKDRATEGKKILPSSVQTWRTDWADPLGKLRRVGTKPGEAIGR